MNPALGLTTRTIVLTNNPDAQVGCDAHYVDLPLDGDAASRSLKIKTLKMMRLPVDARVYFWLDVDIRPVAAHAAWLRGFLRKVVTSQTSPNPYLENQTLALTRTRRDVKYNGGLFMYADHHCLDLWERELRDVGNSAGRDQPALLKTATGPNCRIVDLPEFTQGYFTTQRALDALLGRTDRAFDHALMHFTGSAHASSFWTHYLT